MHDAQMIGFLVAGRVRRHVGHDAIRLAAEHVFQLFRRVGIEKVHHGEIDARNGFDIEQVDADDLALARVGLNLLRGVLRPAAGRRAKIHDLLPRLQKDETARRVR